jgi:hypothetical protein
MKMQMTTPAQPFNLQRLVVVIVMHLRLFRTAFCARLFSQLAALKIDIGVTSCAIFNNLRWRNLTVSPSMLLHEQVMTFSAV